MLITYIIILIYMYTYVMIDDDGSLASGSVEQSPVERTCRASCPLVRWDTGNGKGAGEQKGRPAMPALFGDSSTPCRSPHSMLSANSVKTCFPSEP